MATTAMVDCYVRQLLEEERGEDLEVVDGHDVLTGDHPVRVWVVSGNHRTRRVLVTAVVLTAVELGTELLEALNDLNAATAYGRFFLLDGAVHVEDTVLADVLDPASLFNAVGFVTWAAETQADALAERLGRPAAVPSAGADDGEVELEEPAALELLDTEGPLGSSRAEAVSAGGYL
jgi:hypothetical protein